MIVYTTVLSPGSSSGSSIYTRMCVVAALILCVCVFLSVFLDDPVEWSKSKATTGLRVVTNPFAC